MAKLWPINQFFDASGLPLNAGLIYTYSAGTSTPKTTYTDATASTPHPNPVVLGANGRKEIWLDTDTAYKMVIKDSNDNQIGNAIDNVLPVTAFAASVGASDIDMTGYEILTTGNDDIRLNPHGTGTIHINAAYKLPAAAPASGEFLAGNGTTQLVWSAPSASSLDQISDVTLTAPASGEYLKYNGSAWINAALAGNISSFTNDSGYLTSAAATAFTTIAVSGQSNVVSDSTTDTLTLVAGTGISLTTNATTDTITITNSAPDTTVAAASQAEMEAASSTSVYVSPGRVLYHPAIPKAVCRSTTATSGTANQTLTSNFGVTSIARVAARTYDVTFSTAFSNSNYIVHAQLEWTSADSSTTAPDIQVISKTTTTCRLVWGTTIGGGSYTVTESAATFINLSVWGDQ